MKEKKTKTILLSIIGLFSIITIITFAIKLPTMSLASLILLVGASLVYVILEAYLRIQHHIDMAVREIIEKIYHKMSTLSKEQNVIKENFIQHINIISEKQEKKDHVAQIKYNENIKILENNLSSKIKEITSHTLSLNNLIDNTKRDINTQLSSQKNKINKIFDINVQENRKKQLENMTKKVFTYKSVLYIGARADRYHFLPEFYSAGYKISVLEIHKPNVEFLKTIKWIDEVIDADITKYEGDKKYDVVFWWHGPEHISKNDLENTLTQIEKIARKLIVLGCPWGNVPQDKSLEEKNVYEKHINSITIGDFESLGYKTSYQGSENVIGSNIIAIKEKK